MAKKPVTTQTDQSDPALINDVAQALEDDQFFLVYQPTIDLQTNGFAGVESLMRWRHPERGVLTPESFLAQLEASGQINAVGRWVLNTACQQGAEWHAKGYRFTVSVNVSSMQFESSDFVFDVDRALSASRFDPTLLVLEFSQQTLLHDHHTVVERLLQLRELGVHLAIDDFAPGQLPLEDLQKLPIDIVKIDREFVAGIKNSEQAISLIHTVVQLARTLNIQITASGIEDADQRQQLQSEEVEIGQGFHFSQPREAREINRYLEDYALFSGKPL